ncbi:MAG: hypothetical protein QXN39_02365 [Archaeoglobaceae archaeon]
MNDDYASLIDLEYAETPGDFADALHKFLRRFESLARKKQLRRPEEKALEELACLVDAHGVRMVKAALISHALCRAEREEEEIIDEETSGGEQPWRKRNRRSDKSKRRRSLKSASSRE